jgi:outer membrane lipoprotein SlyB
MSPFPPIVLATQRKSMKIAQTLFTGVIAMSVLMPLTLLTAQAQTQQYSTSYSAPRIEGFDVEEVRRLAPGIDLSFTMYGTPGGSAALRIDGARRNLALTEVEAGRYEGSYTISLSDKIAARSPVTANLRVGNQVASAVLRESLQIGVGAHTTTAAPGPAPKITRFNMVPVADLGRGQDLDFTVHGTSGGKVDLTIDGVKGKVLLPEVGNGVYEGTYTIRSRDRISANSIVTANLLLGERTTSMKLGQAMQSAAAPAPVARSCYDCGTIEAVNRVEVKGDGSYLGTIGGGVIGALLGNQVGGGNGKKVATVAGAVGGAFAGHAIEAKVRNASHYEVLVRMQNGAAQTVVYAEEPGLRVGEAIKLNDGVITRTQ